METTATSRRKPVAEKPRKKRAVAPAQPSLPPDRPGDGESLEAFAKRHFGAHPGQLAFLRDPSMYRCAVAGIGGGKTELGCFEQVRRRLQFPGSRGLAVSPTYRMLYRSLDPTLQKVLRWWGKALIWKHSKSENKVVFPQIVGPSGEPSEIIYAHCQDPDSLRAVEVADFMLDEGALARESVFQVLQGRIRQPGYPHAGWITTTPKGRDWVYRAFYAEREHWPEWQQAMFGFHTWTTHANPLYAAEPQYLQALEKTYVPGTDWYRQEIGAEFVSFRGLVYRLFDDAEHVAAEPPKVIGECVAGVDWGVSSPGCISVLGKAPDGTIWLLDEVYERDRVVLGRPGRDWVSAAKDVMRQWRVSTFYADPADANAVRTFRAEGIPTNKADNSRLPGVRQVEALIASDKFRVVGPNCPNTLTEFGQYHWREDRDGNPIEDADPAKEFDHAMDAIRYGVMGLTRGGMKLAA